MIGLELAQQIDHLNAVITPIGGSGLISGIYIAVKVLRTPDSPRKAGNDRRRIGPQSQTTHLAHYLKARGTNYYRHR
ncbi:MAG: hypothetical protein M2R45_01881 [Verrucomicrobia subdivision 3 bacterium]|nr:hypothetical protein [Limisphaerales bacterium]MCS1415681.1 hypothetical protein [Limisphaerales bacterium]